MDPTALIADSQLTPPAPTMASPSWWGADSVRFRASTETSPVFVKRFTDAATSYIDVGSAVAATKSAGTAGLGPAVLGSDITAGCLALTDLTDTHRTATLADFDSTTMLERLVARRKQVWQLPTTGIRVASVFDDIRRLRRRIADTEIRSSAQLPWMLRMIDLVADRIEPSVTETVVIHGDANCSNVMIDQHGDDLQLVDFDLAATADPLQDIGSLMYEFSFTEQENREFFEFIWGTLDPTLYARARGYAAAEAVRGGLVGALVDHLDPGTFEYSKFSDWMLLRAHRIMASPMFDDDLGVMA